MAGRLKSRFREHRTDYEAELAIVIGRKIRNVTPTQAPRYIFGYTAAAGHQRPHDSEFRKPVGALQIVRHLHAARSAGGDEN